MTDEEIVDSVINGKQHLFEQLMRKYNQRMYRISMSIINDDKEAEDIMQITYINAYQQLGKFEKRSSFSTWLTRILIYESLLHKKRRAKLRKALTDKGDNPFHNDTPLKDLMNKELKQILEKTVADLPEKYRMVFIMREVEEMSTLETAQALELGESNVKIRLSRAKEMLKAALIKNWHTERIYEFNLVRCDVVVNNVIAAICNTK